MPDVRVTPRGHGRADIVFSGGAGEADLQDVTAAIDHGFGVDGLRVLRWVAPVGDVAARRLAWASGFTFGGTERREWVGADGLTDAWVGSLLVEDSPVPKTRWLEAPTLRGERVVLRDAVPADGPRYVQTTLDPESLVWLGTIPMPRTSGEFAGELVTSVVGRSLGTDVSWTIADRADDRYLGTLSLFDLLGLDHSTAEVGYRTHPDARGRGVSREALGLAVEHAFRPEADGGLGLQRLRLGAGAGNLASQAVARAAGFRQVGVDRQCYDRLDGSVVDLVRFDLLATDR